MVGYAKRGDVKAVPTGRLMRRFGSVPPETMYRLEVVLRNIFEL